MREEKRREGKEREGRKREKEKTAGEVRREVEARKKRRKKG